MALHLVAIGGSGQHVALAYVDLGTLVHGLELSLKPVHLYLLDRDQAADSVETAWALVRAQVARLQRLTAAGVDRWPEPNDSVPPAPEFTGKSRVGDVVSRTLAPIFFNDEQLGVEYGTGYWGQAPVGATFFDYVLQHSQNALGAAIADITADPGARVVVTGSTVGGTGAGCLPRLVEHLSSHRDGTPAQVMAIPLLNWFFLSDGDAAPASVSPSRRRNAEMQQRQPSSLIYSRELLAKRSATVIVGHPSVETQGQARTWAGNTQQGAFEDLRVPYYCASVASEYFFTRRPASPGMYAVVRPQGKFALGESLPVFAGGESGNATELQLGNLVATNHLLCHRLYWVVRYLEQPVAREYTWFGSMLEVPSLEPVLASPNRAKIIADLRTLLEAKWHSLFRLSRSQPELFDGAVPADRDFERSMSQRRPEAFDGIVSLKAWTASESQNREPDWRSVTALLASHLPKPMHRAGEKSAHRCLPDTATQDGALAWTTRDPGTLDRVDADRFKRLVEEDKIRPEALPTTRAVEFFLSAVFSRAFDPGAEGAKWVQRWRNMLFGVCTGRLKLRPAERESVEVDLAAGEQVFLAYDEDGNVVGITSPETLLVPGVNESCQRALEMLPWASASYDSKQAIRGWFALVLDLLRHSSIPSEAWPAWLTYNKSWADAEQGGIDAEVGSAFSFVSEAPIRANLGLFGAKEILLPRVADSLGDIRVLAQTFGIQTGYVTLAELPNEFAAVRDPATCPRYRPISEAGLEPERIVIWEKRLPVLAAKLRFGYIWRQNELLQIEGANVEVLTDERSITLASVCPISGGTSDALYPDYAVQLRYAGLIDREGATKNPQPGGVLQSSFSVRGLGRVTVSPSVVKPCVGTYMLWPRFRSVESARTYRAYYALADSNVDRDRLCFVGREESKSTDINWFARLPSGTAPRPLYTIQEDGKVYGGVPDLFTILPPNGFPQGIGLFSIDLEDAPQLPTESWGVDFGTSSSVVAIRAENASDAHVLSCRGGLDQSKVFALASPRPLEGCEWFPTWDGRAKRNSEASPLFPTQLLLRNSAFASRLNKADTLPYGDAFVLDHGGTLKEALSDQAHILTDLKWVENNDPDSVQKRALRKAYVLHLLEIAVTLRERYQGDSGNGPVQHLKPGLPTAVDAVFTLPLRMKDRQAKIFAEDIEAACARLLDLTGVRFTPRFMWESHAGAPWNRAEGQIYVVADLGGGSLDIWGCIGSGQQYADSYRFGGHDLILQWSQLSDTDNGDPRQREMDLRRRFHLNPDDALAGITEKRAGDAQHGFFDLCIEAVARWIGALVLKGPDATRETLVELSLLGMGWGLNKASAGDATLFTNAIQDRVAALLPDQKRARDLHLRLGAASGRDRKTQLARQAAVTDRGATISELLDNTVASFFGFDVESQLDGRISWSNTLPHPLKAQQLFFDVKDVRRQPMPKLVKHELNANQLDQILGGMARAVGGGAPRQYHGQTPFCLALEMFRTNSTPNSR